MEHDGYERWKMILNTAERARTTYWVHLQEQSLWRILDSLFISGRLTCWRFSGANVYLLSGRVFADFLFGLNFAVRKYLNSGVRFFPCNTTQVWRFGVAKLAIFVFSEQYIENSVQVRQSRWIAEYCV